MSCQTIQKRNNEKGRIFQETDWSTLTAFCSLRTSERIFQGKLWFVARTSR
jgi:hypothetical protein